MFLQISRTKKQHRLLKQRIADVIISIMAIEDNLTIIAIALEFLSGKDEKTSDF